MSLRWGEPLTTLMLPQGPPPNQIEGAENPPWQRIFVAATKKSKPAKAVLQENCFYGQSGVLFPS